MRHAFGNMASVSGLYAAAFGTGSNAAAAYRHAGAHGANSATLAYVAVNSTIRPARRERLRHGRRGRRAARKRSARANASAGDAVAIGTGSLAMSTNAVALGTGAQAQALDSVAIGTGAVAVRQGSLALGSGALASEYGTAIGTNASVTGAGSISFGSNASAGFLTTAIGRAAIGTSKAALLGWSTYAGECGTAIGYDATALGTNSTALGYQATTVHEGSTAIGANATTTAANQLMLGASGTSVVIADLDASTDAQSGPVDVVTVDANGMLGRQAVATTASVDAVRSSVDAIAAVSDAQFDALAGRVGTLEQGLLDTNYRIDALTDEARAGIAAAMAQAEPPFPPEAGQTGYAMRGATFRGQFGFSLGLSHRLATEAPITLTASISHAGDSNTGGTVGIAGIF